MRAANEHRPTLVLGGDLDIELNPGAELTLNGLLIAGGRCCVCIPAAVRSRPRLLRLRHCTLVPGLALTRAGAPVSPDQPSLIIDRADTMVEIDHCIVGAIARATASAGSRSAIRSSMRRRSTGWRLPIAMKSLAGGNLTVMNSTVDRQESHGALGSGVQRDFHGPPRRRRRVGRKPVISDQNQQGCVRFSFLPLEFDCAAPLSLPAGSRRNCGARGGGRAQGKS